MIMFADHLPAATKQRVFDAIRLHFCGSEPISKNLKLELTEVGADMINSVPLTKNCCGCSSMQLNCDKTPFLFFLQLMTDVLFTYATLETIRLQSAGTTSPVFFYELAHASNRSWATVVGAKRANYGK